MDRDTAREILGIDYGMDFITWWPEYIDPANIHAARGPADAAELATLARDLFPAECRERGTAAVVEALELAQEAYLETL